MGRKPGSAREVTPGERELVSAVMQRHGYSDEAVAALATKRTGRQVGRSTVQRIRTRSGYSTVDIDAVMEALGITPESVDDMDRLIAAYKSLVIDNPQGAHWAVNMVASLADKSEREAKRGRPTS